MEELLEKPKRIRRKKELPPFSVERKEGEIRNIPIELSNSIDYLENNHNLISPYTEFIPLVYMLYDGVMCRGNDNASTRAFTFRDLGKDWIEKLEKRNKHNPIEHLYMRCYGNGKKETTKRAKGYINDYIIYDDCLSITNMHNSYSKSGVFDTIRVFKVEHGFGFSSQFYMRSYNGLVSPFSLIVKNSDREYSPHILAVIPPENFIYMKYEWLLTGNIDLSKIVILIDRELDNTEFPNKPFRALYKKEIQPYLETLNTTIAKVPIEYIKEKCFVGKYKLKSRNIIERKKEIEKITENFISSIAVTVDSSDWTWTEREPSPYIIQTGREGMQAMNEALFQAVGNAAIPSYIPSLGTTYRIGVDLYRGESEGLVSEQVVFVDGSTGDTRDLGGLDRSISYLNNERIRDLQMQYNVTMNELNNQLHNELGVPNVRLRTTNNNGIENLEPVAQEHSIEDESPW